MNALLDMTGWGYRGPWEPRGYRGGRDMADRRCHHRDWAMNGTANMLALRDGLHLDTSILHGRPMIPCRLISIVKAWQVGSGDSSSRPPAWVRCRATWGRRYGGGPCTSHRSL